MQCPHHLNLNRLSGQSEFQISPHKVIKRGHFFRLYDKALIQRYYCTTCKTNFSEVSNHPCKYQKKPFLNYPIFEQLVSGTSQRRLAKLLRINKKTVVRKFIFLGKRASESLKDALHLQNKKFEQIQFDDMESFEHTKCKPISITLVVEEKTRFILGFRTASMPAKGLLVKKALKKYGRRKDERAQKRKELFQELKPYINKKAIIKSDENPHYPKDIRRFFPTSKHLVYKGRRGCVVGQGELKAGGFDPIFSLNHTAAMLRANINRLFRRTWNTTKKIAALDWHIALYCWYHNCFLIDY
jgi:transposase-like protein